MSSRVFHTFLAKIPYGFSLTPSALIARLIRSNRYSTFGILFLFLLYGLKNEQIRDLGKSVRLPKKRTLNLNAQNLQDIAAITFCKNERGQYLDLGACHARKYSNSYLLQQLGWSGVLVEANPIFWADLSTRVSDKTHLLKSGVGIDFGKLQLLNAGPLSSFAGFEKEDTDGELRNKLSTRDGSFEIEVIPAKVIPTQYFNSSDLSYLSIDIEGMDVPVLRQIMDSGYQPEFITIEHNYVQRNVEAIVSIENEYSYRIICSRISAQDFWLQR